MAFPLLFIYNVVIGTTENGHIEYDNCAPMDGLTICFKFGSLWPKDKCFITATDQKVIDLNWGNNGICPVLAYYLIKCSFAHSLVLKLCLYLAAREVGIAWLVVLDRAKSPFSCS